VVPYLPWLNLIPPERIWKFDASNFEKVDASDGSLLPLTFFDAHHTRSQRKRSLGLEVDLSVMIGRMG
jgi:hypothetical protein